jgi:transposase-like protein
LEGMWKSINESRPADRADLAAWYEAILNAQESSGMSVAEAADEVGITATTLYQWRRRLSAMAAPDVDLQPASKLVRVHVRRREEQPREARRSVVLRLGGERSIEVPDGFDADELARLIPVVVAC